MGLDENEELEIWFRIIHILWKTDKFKPFSHSSITLKNAKTLFSQTNNPIRATGHPTKQNSLKTRNDKSLKTHKKNPPEKVNKWCINSQKQKKGDYNKLPTLSRKSKTSKVKKKSTKCIYSMNFLSVRVQIPALFQLEFSCILFVFCYFILFCRLFFPSLFIQTKRTNDSFDSNSPPQSIRYFHTTRSTESRESEEIHQQQ